ncbi:patatin-like phospholipase family protein [Nitratifractor sp.]|uniref:patatin-like phospholipase family protein n=1 Tax=Nitratifractor sp. TaxID=2268144 RepID=UPI0025F266F6|nr:patatin-like phospholipase family protein [Nitratifractor sp.]
MKIALCLSGGALRAAAQIGALRFLEERGVRIAAVSGSSAGAVAALLLAAGWESRRIEGFLRSLRRRDLFRPERGPGIFGLGGVERLLRRELGELRYEALSIPCYSCLTELKTGKSCYLHSGDPIANVLASSSLTPLFGPREIDGVSFIDGGFSDNLPVMPLKAHSLPILSLDVNPLPAAMPTGFRDLLLHSVMIVLNRNIRPSLAMSDAALQFRSVAGMHLFDFRAAKEALRGGYREMEAAWPELERRLRERARVL